MDSGTIALYEERNGVRMRPSEFSPETLATLLRKQKVATLPELMEALGSAKRTVFRKLQELPYRSSYSHRGAYYTLDEVAQFDEQGLWSYQDVWFSTYGTLLSTAVAFVEAGEQGHYVEELDHELHIGTKDALRKLVRDARLSREHLGGQFLYCAADARRRREQVRARRVGLAEPGAAGSLPQAAVLPDELRAAIVLFFSLLDEKQRRLYAGLEALKTGRGGDVRIAELLGLDVGTVARGRRELLTGEVEIDRVRAAGGGRKSTGKKRPTRSTASRN
jgi:hypothetical protein